MIKIFLIALAIFFVGSLVGYFLGWRRGHLTGVEYAVRLAVKMEELSDDEVAQYTRDVLAKVDKVAIRNAVKEEWRQQYEAHYHKG